MHDLKIKWKCGHPSSSSSSPTAPPPPPLFPPSLTSQSYFSPFYWFVWLARGRAMAIASSHHVCLVTVSLMTSRQPASTNTSGYEHEAMHHSRSTAPTRPYPCLLRPFPGLVPFNRPHRAVRFQIWTRIKQVPWWRGQFWRLNNRHNPRDPNHVIQTQWYSYGGISRDCSQPNKEPYLLTNIWLMYVYNNNII